MAECPKCRTNIRYDHCQDAFRFDTGKFLETHNANIYSKKVADVQVTLCQCGYVIGVRVIGSDGDMYWLEHEPDTWGGKVKWGRNPNCWDGPILREHP